MTSRYKKAFWHSYLLCILTILPTISNTSPQKQPVISQQEEIDLELFSDQPDNQAALFKILDRTITSQGRKTLKELLANPTIDQVLLQNRQILLNELINNKQLMNTLHEDLLIINQYAPPVEENFWHEQDAICTTAVKDLYYENTHLKHLNKSPRYLNALQFLHTLSMFAPVIEHIAVHVLFNKALCRSHSHEGNMAVKAFDYGHWALHIYGAKTLYDHIKQKLTLSKKLQSHVMDAKKCLESLRHIHNTIKDTTNVTQNLSSFVHLQSLFDNATLEQTTQMQTLLAKDSFKDEPSLFNNMGNTLAAHAAVQESQALQQALQAAGEIDAYLSIAKLFNEHADKKARYSFANYATSQQPYISAHDFWNPYIGSQTSSTNTIEIGSPMPNTGIITGPNMAGKSTNLRSVAIAILLGQTFGIVPATQLTFTPFCKITTFIKHADNAQAGTSLFTAELIKANLFVDALTNLTPDQFSFVIFDELFKSTSFEKGQDTAYNLIKYIGNFKNNICMASTHYPKLTTLEQADNALFKNYTTHVEKDADGHKLFILKEGSSSATQSFDVIKGDGLRGIWDN